MPKGLLIDTVRCMGCRGCQMACKQWNLIPGVETFFTPTMTNPLELNAYNYTHVDFYEVEEGDKLTWNFVFKSCFHCLNPACVSVCPVGALQKFDNGPVVWEEGRCIGCRYCQMACPFDIPKFEWGEAWPKIQKCHMCWNRINKGLQPACAKACPPDAIEFGERSELLARAHTRIQSNPAKYYNYIYGEREAGGTSLMFLTAVPPEKLGFKTEVGQEHYPLLTSEFLNRIPLEISAIAAILAGAWYIRTRRTKGTEETESVTSEKEVR